MPQINDMAPTALLPLRRNACWGFFRPKNPTASAGFEPANLGTKGQYATHIPPKPRSWDDVEKYFRTEGPRVTMWRMRISCFITEATKTYPEYVILIAFLLQQWVHQRTSMLHCTYIACLDSSNDNFLHCGTKFYPTEKFKGRHVLRGYTDADM